MNPRAPSSGASAARVAQILGCAALEPGLSGVLLLDADPDLVPPLAKTFAAWWSRSLGREPALVTANNATTEDDLWLSLRVRESRTSWGPGPLAGGDDHAPVVVIVPDLAAMSIAAARAAVTLMDAGSAALERNGVSARWRPVARWIAGCDSRDQRLLRHRLLDRFAVRIDASALRADETTDEDGLGRGHFRLPEPVRRWETVLRRAGSRRPRQITPEAAARVVQLIGEDTVGARPDLALARVARALAVMENAGEVTVTHVERASSLIGADDSRAREEPINAVSDSHPGSSAPEDSGHVDNSVDTSTSPSDTFRVTDIAVDGGKPLYAGDNPSLVGSFDTTTRAVLPASESALDLAGAEQPVSLRQGVWRHDRANRPICGPVVGVERATDLRDIAVVSTLLEAARFQALRRDERAYGKHKLIVKKEDLRGNVRARAAGRLLALLLDHTCRGEWDWEETLDPYLRWAHAERACVCVAEVGGSEGNPLQARCWIAQSVLDPALGRALRRPAGSATPLAHGLYLLTEKLHELARIGSVTMEETWFVAVTDGRGNVPLKASIEGHGAGVWTSEGVRDSMLEADRLLRRLGDRLGPVVIGPPGGPHPYAHLPFDLADRMGGVVVFAAVSTEPAAATPTDMALDVLAPSPAALAATPHTGGQGHD